MRTVEEIRDYCVKQRNVKVCGGYDAGLVRMADDVILFIDSAPVKEVENENG